MYFVACIHLVTGNILMQNLNCQKNLTKNARISDGLHAHEAISNNANE